MNKLCLETTHLGKTIEVFENQYGYYFLCGKSNLQDRGWNVIWSSLFNYTSALEAVSICILLQEFDQIDRLERPAAVFSMETGKILHTNNPHFRWLGHGCIQSDRDTILSRIVSPEEVSSRILPIGNRVVGVYEILNATQTYELNISYKTFEWEQVTALNGFACYGEKSQEILSRWVEWGNTSEFYRRYVADFGTLDQLKGIS